MATKHRTRGGSPNSMEAMLPSDALGRLACVLIGTFFGTLGVGSLVLLISNRRGLASMALYELSIVVGAFGISQLLWGLVMPRWLKSLAHHAVSHLLLVIMVLFLPFALEAIVVLFSGKV
jgi:hypothetical protein